MKKHLLAYAFITIITPGVALAQFAGATNFSELLSLITGYAGRIILLLVTIAVVVFFYRIVISIYKVGSDPKAVENGKKLLLWGIVALFVMTSVWGIVNFVGEAVGIKREGSGVIIPQLETRNR
jgi:Type IV secretion system pilin